VKASELAEHILRASTRRLDDEVRIVIHQPGSIGPRPSVGIQQAAYGIDWEADRFDIVPAMSLTRLSSEDVEAIRTSVVKGSSWHAYKAQEGLRARIKELEAEVVALKGNA